MYIFMILNKKYNQNSKSCQWKFTNGQIDKYKREILDAQKT